MADPKKLYQIFYLYSWRYLYQKYPFGDIVISHLQSLGSGKFNVLIDNDQMENIVSDNTIETIHKSLSN